MVSFWLLFLLSLFLCLALLSALSAAAAILRLLPVPRALIGAAVPALAAVLMFSSPVTALAAPATSSDAEPLEELTHPEEEEIDYTPTALTIADGDYTLDYLYEYFKGKVVNDLASASDAKKPSENTLESPNDDPAVPVDSGVYILDDTLPLAAEAETDFVNVVRYNVVLAGRSATLLFPSGSESALFIDSADRLWNVSNDTVQGVVLYDSEWDPTADEGTLIYLAPCLGNNFNSNHDGESPNYIRRYYWERYSYGERLTYDTTYVSVQVTDSPYPLDVGKIPEYVMILLLGGVLICLLKKSLR